MKPAMALLRQEQKDGHVQLFIRMYSFQITQDKMKGGGDDRKQRGSRKMMELVLRTGRGFDLFLNFIVSVCERL